MIREGAAAEAPEEVAATRLGSRSSGTEASAPSPEEAVLNQEAVGSPSVIHPSVESPAAAAVAHGVKRRVAV